MSAAPQYRLTIGLCETHSLTKTYDTAPDGRLLKRQTQEADYYWWRFKGFDCAGDAEAIALLASTQPNPHKCLINGLVAPWVNSRKQCRKLAALSHPDNERSILDGTVSHAIIDIDDHPAKGLGAGKFFRDAAGLIDQELPNGIAGTRKIVLRSPSSGTKPDSINLRMLVPFKEPARLSELAIWQKGAAAAGFPIDPRQGVLGQIAYCAAPVIFGAAPDPIAPEDRVFVLNPDADIADFDVNEFNDLARQVDTRQRTILNEAMARGWRHAADKLIGTVVKTDSGSRFFEPLSAVLGLAARSGEAADTIADYLLPLIKQRINAFDPSDSAGREAHYGRAFIHKHLSSFQRRDAQTDRAIADFRSKIFA
jgi:hypothetical protein